jgi:phage portal protein BeeE
MRLLGFTISRESKSLAPPNSRGGWWPLVRESFAGAWQRNVEIKQGDVMAFPAVFSCQTLIASDIAKLKSSWSQDADGVWSETTNPAYSPVLRRPNRCRTASSSGRAGCCRS